jgi:hypothetical protein
MDKIVENFYKRISDMKENYNEDFLKNKLNSYYESFNIPNLQILYDFSTYFESFFSNVDLKETKNIVLVKNIAKMYLDDPYVNSIAKDCYKSILNFKKFLLDNNMYENFLIKEFSVSFYIIMLFMPLGEIRNLELFETIQKLWLVVDNIVDNKSMNKKYKKLLKPLLLFLKDKIYLNSNVEIFMKQYSKNICIKLIQEVYDNQKLSKSEKTKFFEDARTLFMYSYSSKGIEYEKSQDTNNVLKMSIKKAYLSLSLFKNCFDPFEEDHKIYNLCFIAQISDDLQDLEEDIINEGNTIFTRETRKNRSIITMCLLDFIIENYEGTKYKYLFSIPVIDSILYNHYLLDPTFIKEIVKYKFVNFEKCDIKKMEKIFFEQLIDKFLDDDLPDLYDIDVDKISKEEIISKMKKFNSKDKTSQSVTYLVSEV